MANYNVPNGHRGAWEKVPSAGVVDSVTFLVGSDQSVPGWGNPPREVEVASNGTAALYFTTDGSTPTVGGTNCGWIPASGGWSAVTADVRDANSTDAVVVKVISAGTPTYSVGRTV